MSNVIPMAALQSPEIKAAFDYGYTVHTMTNEDPDWAADQKLVGRWWWCLTKPGWIDIVTDPEDHASEAEAWAAAVLHHKAELSLDAKEREQEG